MRNILTAFALGMPVAAIAQTALPAPVLDGTRLDLTVRGEATRTPDLAVIGAGVVTQAATAGQALSDNAARMTRVLAALRRAGLVESVRGPGGGYKLARAPEAIRVADILGAVDETVSALHKGAAAHGGASGTQAQKLADRLWEGLSAHVYVFLHQTRLSDVVKNQLAPCPAVPHLLELVDD